MLNIFMEAYWRDGSFAGFGSDLGRAARVPGISVNEIVSSIGKVGLMCTTRGPPYVHTMNWGE